MKHKIIYGKSEDILKQFDDDFFDSCVTDPPYGLEFMGKDWDKFKDGENIARFGKADEEGDKDLKLKKNFKVLPRFFASDLFAFQEFTFQCYKVVCIQSSVDMGVCAYKDLGYGCIIPAIGWGHAYNIFWIGGDWRNLNNWMIFDPGSGRIMKQDNPYLCRMYKTHTIQFPMYREGNHIKYAKLKVNFNEKTVTYYNRIEGTSIYLEPFPENFFHCS